MEYLGLAKFSYLKIEIYYTDIINIITLLIHMSNMNNIKQDGTGKRFNQGKIRVDLTPAFAQEEYCRVLTIGAEKYGASNWQKGMKWSNVLASLERHLLAIKKGEDYDVETGLLHSAHIMCNADDRQHKYLTQSRIGLDIGFINTNTIIPFQPACYITQEIHRDLTKDWLEINRLPIGPIYTVSSRQSKVDVVKSANLDIFVDDNYDDFVKINNAGVCCYLFDNDKNKKYNVGHKRLYSLKDLI